MATSKLDSSRRLLPDSFCRLVQIVIALTPVAIWTNSFATVPPPPSVRMNLRGDVPEFIMHELAVAGLNAHLVCFYGSNRDPSSPGLIANCTNRNGQLLFVARTVGSPAKEVWIGSPFWCPEDQEVANRVIQEFVNSTVLEILVVHDIVPESSVTARGQWWVRA